MALASNPGIFWVNSRVATPNVLPYADYVKWYENVHTPDWINAKPGAIDAGFRYQAVDPTHPWPFLVVYRYNDIADFNDPVYMNVSISHPSLPEGGPITKFVEFQAVVGPTIDSWKSPTATEDRGPVLVSESITQDREISDEKFNKWYRTTYINDISVMKGWRRTSRFNNTMRAGGANAKAQPKWLALHEFDEGAFDGYTDVVTLLMASDGARSMSVGAEQLGVTLFRLARQYGNKTISWGNTENLVST
ncbi:hypothetical protein V8F06_009891 [Rhypophila decipiens]